MYPKGTIYEASKSDSFGEVSLSPGTIVRLFYHLLRGIGGGFVAFAMVGVMFSFYPIIKEEISYRFQKKERLSGFGEILSRIEAQNADSVRKEAEKLGLDPYFSAYIPKIDAKSKVIPNVNAGDKNEYLNALSEGIAHAKGTNFPGQGKNVYLFSHSTDSPLNFARYNAVFYLLRKLEKGDKITVYFLDKRYEYQVTEKIVTTANDTSWLEEKGDGERLILQTCDPPGTTWNRLIIVARPIP